jgi:hypothetical protein
VFNSEESAKMRENVVARRNVQRQKAVDTFSRYPVVKETGT